MTTIDTAVFWRDLGERTAKTFLQNFLVAVSAVVALGDFDVAAAASASGLAALITVLMAVVGSSFPESGSPLLDIFERAVKTFTGSLVSTLAVYTGLLEVDWKTALSLAAITTAGSLATSLGGQYAIGSASLVKS